MNTECCICLRSLEKKCNLSDHGFENCQNKIITTECNHKYHYCCWNLYIYIRLGLDIEGESGSISCPLCRNICSIVIEY